MQWVKVSVYENADAVILVRPLMFY